MEEWRCWVVSGQHLGWMGCLEGHGCCWEIIRLTFFFFLFIFLLLPKMSSLAFVSSSYCSPPEHIVGRLNTHNVMSPDSLTSIISVDQRVFCIQSSNLGQWNVQWRHYKAQFSEGRKSTSLSKCQFICILVLNLILQKAEEMAAFGTFASGLSAFHAEKVFQKYDENFYTV